MSTNIYINRRTIRIGNKPYFPYNLFAVEEYKNKTDSKVSFFSLQGKFLTTSYRTKKSTPIIDKFVPVQDLSNDYIPLVQIYILFKDFS